MAIHAAEEKWVGLGLFGLPQLLDGELLELSTNRKYPCQWNVAQTQKQTSHVSKAPVSVVNHTVVITGSCNIVKRGWTPPPAYPLGDGRRNAPGLAEATTMASAATATFQERLRITSRDWAGRTMQFETCQDVTTHKSAARHFIPGDNSVKKYSSSTNWLVASRGLSHRAQAMQEFKPGFKFQREFQPSLSRLMGPALTAWRLRAGPGTSLGRRHQQL
ncbi:hypothetical protein F5888DRAFT_1887473 [Russula emetica]|nr:hypothetical protein F5888DRAFT_1887473 [Russula emetica]